MRRGVHHGQCAAADTLWTCVSGRIASARMRTGRLQRKMNRVRYRLHNHGAQMGVTSVHNLSRSTACHVQAGFGVRESLLCEAAVARSFATTPLDAQGGTHVPRNRDRAAATTTVKNRWSATRAPALHHRHEEAVQIAVGIPVPNSDQISAQGVVCEKFLGCAAAPEMHHLPGRYPDLSS